MQLYRAHDLNALGIENLDFLKDLSEAWSQRLRSPIIGSIAISFFAVNWQPIWYLLFADRPVRQKFLYFDANTSFFSLAVFPVLAGVILAMATPWLRTLGAWWAQRPNLRMNSIQHKAAHDLKVLEILMETERVDAEANLQAKQERAKIEAARRLEEAGEVGGEELKEDIEKDRQSNSGDQFNDRGFFGNIRDWSGILSPVASQFLTSASRGDGLIIFDKTLAGTKVSAGKRSYGQHRIGRELANLESALEELKRFSLIKSQNASGTHFVLTTDGYTAADQLERSDLSD
ncbi:hypothetical protein [Ruegeria sp. R14_0]|uniref:hypothetical protein n=1 Tax=Ruegeria sp. R14_0 TaxID=2821100 RepID=UPI001AD9679D|nr:hypothetical protein [Ruegeria sp. R14_0]MBO9445501.1 hypothetical protein [Ruegeria sp. R14_0]